MTCYYPNNPMKREEKLSLKVKRAVQMSTWNLHKKLKWILKVCGMINEAFACNKIVDLLYLPFFLPP